MPRPSKTTAEIQSMRERILDAAFAILKSEGVEAVTSRAIARKLDMAHMGLFTYFENQADLLDSLREREMTRWVEQRIDYFKRAQSEEVTQVVREYLESYISFSRENPYLFRLPWVSPQVIDKTPEAGNRRRRAAVENFAKILDLGMERGVFKRRVPLLAASTVLIMINAPNVSFFSGHLQKASFRDQITEEILAIAMDYLIGKNEA